MSQPFRVSLRAGEKVYINGAVLKVDRKVTLELLNDVTFLLGSHVLQADEATTPLRQLYFVVQAMLMEPDDQETKVQLFREFHKAQCETFEVSEILEQLKVVGDLVEDERHYEALRTLRKMFPVEDEIFAGAADEQISIDTMPRSSADGNYAA